MFSRAADAGFLKVNLRTAPPMSPIISHLIARANISTNIVRKPNEVPLCKLHARKTRMKSIPAIML